jgi:thiol-disulfide isomerase/thioredoxin
MNNLASKLLLILITLLYTNTLLGFTRIYGHIDMDDSWKRKIYISEMSSYQMLNSAWDGTVVDSIEIGETGYFDHTTSRLKAGLYRFNIQKKDVDAMASIAFGTPNENFLYVFFDYEGDMLELKLDAQHFNERYQIVKGSSVSKILRKLQEQRSDYYKGVKEVYRELEELNSADIDSDSLGQLKSQLINRLGKVAEQMQKQIKPLIDTVTHVEAGLVATMYYNLGGDFGKYVDYFDELYKKWLGYCSGYGCQMLSEFGNKIYNFKHIIPIGSKVPNIALPDTNNNIVSLYDCDAELVLIDFWASWCNPCRKEATELLIPLYEKYNKNGLEIFSVSIEKNTATWKKAIVKDGYNWITAIDTLGTGKSELLNSFDVHKVPTNYLIDKNKTVIAKDIHGTALQRYVVKYLKHTD